MTFTSHLVSSEWYSRLPAQELVECELAAEQTQRHHAAAVEIRVCQAVPGGY